MADLNSPQKVWIENAFLFWYFDWNFPKNKGKVWKTAKLIFCMNLTRFLVACTGLYRSPCRSVGRSVRRLVGPSVRNTFVKIAENGVMQDEDASYVVCTALFWLWKGKLGHICTNLMYIHCITAKLAIFSTDMPWESCSKLNFEQLSHSMPVENIASLAVIQ